MPSELERSIEFFQIGLDRTAAFPSDKVGGPAAAITRSDQLFVLNDQTGDLQIVEMALNGSGVRDTARVVGMGTGTVMKELKKRGPRSSRSTRQS